MSNGFGMQPECTGPSCPAGHRERAGAVSPQHGRRARVAVVVKRRGSDHGVGRHREALDLPRRRRGPGGRRALDGTLLARFPGGRRRRFSGAGYYGDRQKAGGEPFPDEALHDATPVTETASARFRVNEVFLGLWFAAASPTWASRAPRSRNSSVARLKVSGSSCRAAWERWSKTTSSLPAIPLGQRLGEARRAHRSCAPKVIRVGTSTSPSTALASWAMAASVWARNASSGLGRAAAHEVHQRGDEVRPFGVHLGREAPREDALDDDVGDRRQRRASVRHSRRRPSDSRRWRPSALCSDSERTRRMPGGQVHAHRGAERDAGDVGPLDPDRVEERGHLVGVAPRSSTARAACRSRPSREGRSRCS